MKFPIFPLTILTRGAQLLLAQTSPSTPPLSELVVTSSPLGGSLSEQTQSVSVLEGDALQLRLQPTLGETLSHTPGVSSSYFGPAASRPVIRGLDGDRIRVLQNGTNTIDASATSVDHAVSFDPISIQSVEIVRGPATLLYGPNAIGGVVNAIDNRIPTTPIESPLTGSLESRYDSTATGRGGAFTLEGGLAGFNWHLEGYQRATADLRIPGSARSARLRESDPLPAGENEAVDTLPNSNLRTEGLSGGLSYIWEKGYLGVAYSGFNTNYGTVAEREVTIDLEQRRWDVKGAFFDPVDHVKSIKYSVGVSDYEHTEFEGQEVGTKFENEGYDGRIELAHQPFGPVQGVIGYQTEKSDFSALGEEAFVPPVETLTNSGFIFEEIALHSHWKVQAGARYDHITADAEKAEGFGAADGRTFNNLSGSLGVLFNPAETYTIALNTAFTQRAPTYQELFANGPHVATAAFEIGDRYLDPERAFSIDLSLRKNLGFVTGSISGFYYHFNDFIGQFATGGVVAGEEDDLPIFIYRATAAEFFGGEAEVTFHLLAPVTEPASPAAFAKDGKTLAAPQPVAPAVLQTLDLLLTADYVHAEDTRANEPLPRIPPFRASAALRYQLGRFSAGLEGQFAARQERISEVELATDRYFLLNADLGYKVPLKNIEMDIFVRGENLTNEEARLSTSFLKDIAPLAGRGVAVGLKFTF